MNNGVMLTEDALRCVAQDIELYYKKKAPNGAWCITTCRNAATQFEQMRAELNELRRAEPEDKPLTLDELRATRGLTRSNYGKTWLAYRHKPKEEV